MDDHQTMNATAVSSKGAAVLLPDRELTGERLTEEIRKLLADPKALRDMARNAFALSRPDAARRIAEAVEKLGGGAPQSQLHLPEDYDKEGEAEDERQEEKA
jgi:UDP-N-acetylglucosamine--N-acetylmuramyl-(pentapeptide) pyrophosphoryl-undecaprenol N-acetylglucosamine transferase